MPVFTGSNYFIVLKFYRNRNHKYGKFPVSYSFTHNPPYHAHLLTEIGKNVTLTLSSGSELQAKVVYVEPKNEDKPATWHGVPQKRTFFRSFKLFFTLG